MFEVQYEVQHFFLSLELTEINKFLIQFVTQSTVIYILKKIDVGIETKYTV